MSMRYFIPDWDDRVDPGFDFLTDTYTPGRNPTADDRYAHEIFDQPPYDGILFSLATLDQNRAKREAMVAAGGVHRYLRLPADGGHAVLGDCGAFTYWNQPEPPYRTEDVLQHYQELGFNYGVSVDHLIFAELEEEKQRRWDMTIHNAEEFLQLHQQLGYTFTPIGMAQGWDAPSYAKAVRALVKMGYKYIAVGGLVRNRDDDIIKTLCAVREELPPGMQVHLFGVSRPEHAAVFAALGITSFDSAVRLRRAWLDSRRNYFLGDDAYTAIRIPVTSKPGDDEVRKLERAALDALRAYDRTAISLEETHAAVTAYALQVQDEQRRVEKDYLRTLKDRPWERCPCTICQELGVEIIIFRGNNRNRRRGFHNTWQLYQQIQAIDGSMTKQPDPLTQLGFDL